MDSRPGARSPRAFMCWLIALVAIVSFPITCEAQQAPQTVRVATRVLPPMVVQKDGQLSGFSIELWDRIAERLKLETRYEPFPDVRALLAAVREGRADLGIAAVSITAEREAMFDFSQPMMNAGLQIMVRSSGETSAGSYPIADLARQVLSPQFLLWLGIALALSLIPAHVIWFLERRHPEGMLPTTRYIPGIFHAAFWAITTLAAQGDGTPRQWLARGVSVLWKFTAVVFVAFYTAQLTAALTVQQIQSGIGGPEDLPGKKVGTTRGSTSVAQLRQLNASVQEFSAIEDAYRALVEKKVDAVVFDAPVLLHIAANQGKGHVQVVGSTFHKEDYGIVFPPDVQLRKRVNAALLALREDGSYDRIYEKWFSRK